MRKQIWMMALLLCLVCTGCQNAYLEDIRKNDVSPLLLRNQKKNELLMKNEENIVEMWKDEWDEKYVPVIQRALKENLMKEYEEEDGEDVDGYVVDSFEHLKTIAGWFAEQGLEGWAKEFGEGVDTNIYSVGTCTTVYGVEGENGQTVSYNLIFDHIYSVPEKYQSFVVNQLKNGYVLKDWTVGGYLEYLQFDPIETKEGGPTNSIVVIFHDAKPVQVRVELYAQQESLNNQASAKVFQDNQVDTATNLIASVTGDNAGAEKFVKTLKYLKKEKGTIGKTPYKMMKDIESEDVWHIVIGGKKDD